MKNRRNWTEKRGCPWHPPWIRQCNYMQFLGKEGQNNKLAPITFGISAQSGKSWIRHYYINQIAIINQPAHFLSSCEHIKQLVENTLVPNFSHSTLKRKIKRSMGFVNFRKVEFREVDFSCDLLLKHGGHCAATLCYILNRFPL